MSDLDDSGPHPPVTPRSSLGSGGLSFSSGSSISPSTSSTGSQGSAKAAVSECLGAWLNYLQILNNLCGSGYRLAQTIAALEQWGNPDNSQGSGTSQPGSSAVHGGGNSNHTAIHFANSWDDLARATTVATNTVKSHVVGLLQDFVTVTNTIEQEIDVQKTKETNEQIILDNIQSLVSLQHQFCVASYDSFSSLMCCFACQAPVGFPHEPECTLVSQKASTGSTGDPRSQTPSPNFNTLPTQKPEAFKICGSDVRATLFGSGSTQASSEHGFTSGISIEQTRGPSPHQEIRGPSPVHNLLENVRGPLPNPGQLNTMKAPFPRGSRSPLNYPLFHLNGQRRWSEAAAGEVRDCSTDAESQMRRWSMPWEASKTDKSTVTWHQTKVTPTSKLAVPFSKSGSDRSQSTTPDSLCQQPSITSQDGLAEAIQLLSFRPMRSFGPPMQTMTPASQSYLGQHSQQQHLQSQQQQHSGQIQCQTSQQLATVHFAGTQTLIHQYPCMAPHHSYIQQPPYVGQQHYTCSPHYVPNPAYGGHIPLMSQQVANQQQLPQSIQQQQQQIQSQQQQQQSQHQPCASIQSPVVQHTTASTSFIEEPASYEMWSTGPEDRIPSIKFPPKDNENDENTS